MDKEIFQNKNFLISSGVIVLCIILSILNLITKESNENKYLENKDYVFTVDKTKNSKLPFINIDSEEVQYINDELEKKYYRATTSKLDTYLTYESNVKDNFISVLVTEKSMNDKNDIPDINYYTYYIDIKTKDIYTNNNILEKYNLNYNNIEKIVEQELQKQYSKEVKEGYIVYQECDIACYKEIRKYTSVQNNMNFYVKDNKVYGYLNITNKTYYYTQTNFPEYKYLYEF